MLDAQGKKISLTLFLRASAIFTSVFVVVTVIDPLSRPEIIARDTLAFFASSSCVIPISSLYSFTLYCKLFTSLALV